jgi:hypothetical protein
MSLSFTNTRYAHHTLPSALRSILLKFHVILKLLKINYIRTELYTNIKIDRTRKKDPPIGSEFDPEATSEVPNVFQIIQKPSKDTC